MSNSAEYIGRPRLAQAANEVLEQPWDLCVVRELITDPGSLNQLSSCTPQKATEILYKTVPEFEVVDDVVLSHWADVGYDGYCSQRLTAEQLRQTTIGPHLDKVLLGAREVDILMGSLCLSGSRTFGATLRPEFRFKKIDGSFNYSAYQDFFDDGSYEMLRDSTDRIGLRTKTLLRPGDLALFSGHPKAVFHAVEAFNNEEATARMISWIASK